ncbi:MAG TPA: hypothetical protein VL588_08905 [Bdellovibrionota bacterium]|jgi:hypothetical protein|nr:hypothetical protein [Bdellovibrionota bacterium]
MSVELSRALPQSLNFYEMGTLAQSSEGSLDLIPETATCASFFIKGLDRNASLHVFFETELGEDASAIVEAGNVLASRLAGRLSAIPSPPALSTGLTATAVLGALSADHSEARVLRYVLKLEGAGEKILDVVVAQSADSTQEDAHA